MDASSRAYQRLLHDVDDIYFGHSDNYGHSAAYEEGRTLEDTLCDEGRESFYWLFLDRPMRQWFKDNIAGDKENHPSNSTMGLMMFFE
jgi:hypothetical protein